MKRERLCRLTLITYSYWRQNRYLRTGFICKKNLLDEHLLIKERPSFNSGSLQVIPCSMFTMWTVHWWTPSNKYQTSRWQLLLHFWILWDSKCFTEFFYAIGNKCFSFGVFPQQSLCKMTLWKFESVDSESLSLKDSKIFWKVLKFVISIARIRWWKSRNIKQTTILKLQNLLNKFEITWHI